jgi:hypothetical protein
MKRDIRISCMYSKFTRCGNTIEVAIPLATRANELAI